MIFIFSVSLLSSARNARKADLAKETTHHISQLFPDHRIDQTSASILLANTLASSGDVEESSTIRWKLSQSGARKMMGVSWTVINGKILVNDNFFKSIDLMRMFCPFV
jgi:hypothetical protein